MELTKISKIFDVQYGNSFELVNLEQDNSGINFISRTSSNNGVSAKVKIIKDIKPFDSNVLTVSLGGSVLETFIQAEPFYTGFHIFVLKPKRKMSERELIYYCICIRKNKYKYSYGRQANRTLRDLFIPANVPDKFLKLKIEELSNKPVSSKKISLSDRKWEWFNLGDLFNFEKGERLTRLDRTEGDVPLITAGENNNGVSKYISFENFKDKKKLFENKITIDMFFNVFYHDYKYFSDDNIHTLIPINFELRKFNSLFLVTILSKLKYKYAYGRQVRLMRLPFEKIKLPIDKNGNPDWQFMEDYIKSLPYSAGL